MKTLAFILLSILLSFSVWGNDVSYGGTCVTEIANSENQKSDSVIIVSTVGNETHYQFEFLPKKISKDVKDWFKLKALTIKKKNSFQSELVFGKKKSLLLTKKLDPTTTTHKGVFKFPKSSMDVNIVHKDDGLKVEFINVGKAGTGYKEVHTLKLMSPQALKVFKHDHISKREKL